jgi:hypothetical protein
LKDHDPIADNILGRILPPLEVVPWEDPDTKTQSFALKGKLRFDDLDAIEKVKGGLYSHLSITFDESEGTLFEVSVVAIPAASRSVILSQNLSQGDKNMAIKERLSSLAGKHKGLQAQVELSRKNRVTSLAALKEKQVSLSREAKGLSESVEKIMGQFKTAQVRSKMLGFVKEGKMTPKEYKDTNMASLAALDENAMKIVLSSYENRAVSTDVLQFGTSGHNMVGEKAIPDKEKMLELVKLQREGKKVSLSEDDHKGAPEDKKDKSLEDGGDEETESFSNEDIQKCIGDLGELCGKLKKMHDSLIGASSDTEKLSGDDEKDSDEEKKHLSEDDGESKEGEE